MAATRPFWEVKPYRNRVSFSKTPTPTEYLIETMPGRRRSFRYNLRAARMFFVKRRHDRNPPACAEYFDRALCKIVESASILPKPRERQLPTELPHRASVAAAATGN